MKLALCVGHARHSDEGAVSIPGWSEEDFNLHVARATADILAGDGIDISIFDEYEGDSYSAAMDWLAAAVSDFDVAAEFHFNAGPPEAEGHEFLHCHSSREGRRLCDDFAASFALSFPWSPFRGCKELSPDDNGHGFVCGVEPVAAICEPFFGTNKAEANFFGNESGILDLAECYATALRDYHYHWRSL
jgi:N-acetylmuramoyl-L-alanine amidase